MWLRAATLLGLVALSAVALTTLYQSMMKERTAQLSNLVVLAHAAAQKAHDKEKSGALSREDAIKEATRTIGSFVDKDNLAVEVHTLPIDTTSILHAISAMRDNLAHLVRQVRDVPEATLRAALQSVAVFDHPDRSQRGRTITHAHYFDLGTAPLPAVQADDDALQAEWIPVGQIAALEAEFFEDHFHMLDHFLQITGLVGSAG